MSETAFDLQAFIDQKGFWQDNPKASCKGVALVDAITHIEQLQVENKRLENENLKLKNTVLGVYNHLRKHHYSGAFYELETLLDEIMEQTSIDG